MSVQAAVETAPQLSVVKNGICGNTNLTTQSKATALCFRWPSAEIVQLDNQIR